MNKKLLFIAAILLSTIFSSCKKNDDGTPEVDTKKCLCDSVSLEGVSTSYYKYYYNQQGLMTKVDYYDQSLYRHGLELVYSSNNVITKHYRDTEVDSLIFDLDANLHVVQCRRHVFNILQSRETQIDTTFYDVNSDGFPVIIITHSHAWTPAPTDYSYKEFKNELTYTNGNPVEEKIYFNNVNIYNTTRTFLLDDAKYQPYPGSIPTSSPLNYVYPFSKNVILSETTVNVSNSAQSDYTYVNEFNDFGYLKKVTWSGDGVTYVYDYWYTCE